MSLNKWSGKFSHGETYEAAFMQNENNKLFKYRLSMNIDL